MSENSFQPRAGFIVGAIIFLVLGVVAIANYVLSLTAGSAPSWVSLTVCSLAFAISAVFAYWAARLSGGKGPFSSRMAFVGIAIAIVTAVCLWLGLFWFAGGQVA